MTRSKNMSSTGRTTDLKRRDESEPGAKRGKNEGAYLYSRVGTWMKL